MPTEESLFAAMQSAASTYAPSTASTAVDTPINAPHVDQPKLDVYQGIGQVQASQPPKTKNFGESFLIAGALISTLVFILHR